MTALTPLLAPDAVYDPAAHQRAEVRNNVFVSAVLHTDGGSVPVRIRDMSRGGALIESAVIPPEDSPVRLIRGSLSANGHIAWRKDNRAGIRFGCSIEVGDWLPRANGPTEQQRVDEMIHACRTATAEGDESIAPATASSKAEAIRQLLDYRDSLNAVAEELAGDLAVAKGHPTALQALDMTAGMLAKLAARLAGQD